jgi:hypothetical protein
MTDRPRYSIADLLIVMVGAAIGLAGGTWMQADLFAAIVGLLTLVGLLVVHLFPPQKAVPRMLWSALVCGYIAAVCTALIKSAMR